MTCPDMMLAIIIPRIIGNIWNPLSVGVDPLTS